VSFPRVATTLLLVAALAACGGHKNSSADQDQSNTQGAAAGIMTGSPAPSPSDQRAIGSTSAGEGGSMMAQGVAESPMPVPASLNCGAVQPVWVNERSHVYHEPSDPLYGRTKHGKYLCPSTAMSEGYRKAGSRSRHYKHHHRGEMEQPSPAAT
jgi:hypothetical protein